MTDVSSPNTEEQNVVKATIHENIQKLLEMINCAEEWGIFEKDSDSYTKISNKIIDTTENLSQNELNKAAENSRLARYYFNQTLNSCKKSKRFCFSFGGINLIYLLAVLSFAFFSWIFFNDTIVNSTLFWVPSWAFFWGLIGGTLQGFWFLWQHVSNCTLRKNWTTWYILLPLMGSLLGALAYLVFYSGFIAATGESQIKSEFFVMLLTALAGFSTKWAVEMLDNVTKMIRIAK